MKHLSESSRSKTTTAFTDLLLQDSVAFLKIKTGKVQQTPGYTPRAKSILESAGTTLNCIYSGNR